MQNLDEPNVRIVTPNGENCGERVLVTGEGGGTTDVEQAFFGNTAVSVLVAPPSPYSVIIANIHPHPLPAHTNAHTTARTPMV